MTLVFDASAATKWFEADEVSADESLGYLMDEDSRVWIPDNCAHEVVNGVFRRVDAVSAARAWTWMREAGVTIACADESLVVEALLVAEQLGCDYYDALAPALARMLDGTLISADRRAHATFPDVVLLG